MNFFSSDVFLAALAEARFAGRRTAVGLFDVRGRIIRTLEVDGEPVLGAPFLDFFQPLDQAQGPARPLPFAPRVALSTARIDAPVPAQQGLQPSPFVDWSLFSKWQDFQDHVKARRSSLAADSRRRRNRLERELGALEFRLHDDRPQAFDSCLRWKSSQYLATGNPDLFAEEANVRLFRALQQSGALCVTTLSAGGRLIAAHLGASHEKKLYWWVPAYDPDYARYSAGRLLLEGLLEAGHGRGDSEFDFLVGDEEYKWFYATHNRAIGACGDAPLKVRLRNGARRLLAGHPRLRDLARTVIRAARPR